MKPTRNSYQMLKINNIDESKETLIESTKTSEDTNEKSYPTEQENNGNEYIISNIIL